MDKKPESKKATTAISVRLPDDLVQSVNKIALQELCSVTSIVGRALTLYVEKYRAAAEGHASLIASLNREAALDIILSEASKLPAAPQPTKPAEAPCAAHGLRRCIQCHPPKENL